MDYNNRSQTTYCLVITTTDKQEVADNIGNKLVKDKLAACVQINNIQSIYRWQGKIESGKELRLVIKTKTSNYRQIEDIIKALHNYTLPQIVKIDITGGNAECLKWLNENC